MSDFVNLKDSKRETSWQYETLSDPLSLPEGESIAVTWPEVKVDDLRVIVCSLDRARRVLHKSCE